MNQMINNLLYKFTSQIKKVVQEDSIDSKVLQGRILADINSSKDRINAISDVEFKVYSQWGDDGIIQYILSKIKIPQEQQVFVEFGVENYTESNTRFLVLKDNWSGLVIDGSQAHIDFIRNDKISWRHHLTSTCAFITKDNINQLIKDAGIQGEIGILSVDIDGNDYWVWDAIHVVDPIVVITEYNSVWGYDKPYTVPYQDDFVRSKAHYSNLFYGTSLLSACDLAEEKGYDFIGCNSAGNNAYFIRKDKNNFFQTQTPEQGFVDAKFRESRDEHGNLTFLSGKRKFDQLKGLKVINTRTKKEEIL